MNGFNKHARTWVLLWLTFVSCMAFIYVVVLGRAQSTNSGRQPPRILGQTQAEADTKSRGCLSCHAFAIDPPLNGISVDYSTMHPTGTVTVGCTDCHGGNPDAILPAGVQKPKRPDNCEDRLPPNEYDKIEEDAHPKAIPHNELYCTANPVRAYTAWMRRSKEYVRFVNPGDLRVLEQTCGRSGCHVKETQFVRTSMMTHGAMLWEAALYNNGAFPYKDAYFGQSYGPDGQPQDLFTWPPPKAEDTQKKGILPMLRPLERWEISQPGNVLRVFERGGGKREELGNPAAEDSPGRPDAKLSDRGFGTLVRTDPVFLGLQKTRLYDPLLSFPGTNDHPGDYRGSGCTACHVIYANDRDPAHSGPYSESGNQGFSSQIDDTIDKKKSGHPIRHVFTKQIPSSQCMVCHIHPGTNMVASYYGDTFWDNEVDGEQMYPKDDKGHFKQKNPSQEELRKSHMANPDGSAARGKWSDDKFLRDTGEPESNIPGKRVFNQDLEHTRFDDFHGHGWIFRRVFKQDREGNLLGADDQPLKLDNPTTEEKFKKAVQLKDIHLEKGMHCIDCHFYQDVHGNGNLYGETRNAIEISCIDCHGTIQSETKLTTSGPAAPDGGTKLWGTRTPWKELRFYRKDGLIFQRSSVEPGKEWEIVQVKDVVTPGRPHYNQKGRVAMTLGKNGTLLDTDKLSDELLAHPNSQMTCFSCHSSWTTSCFGCHLPMTANQRMPMLQNEGTMTRNWTEYDFQVLRNDMYMLGRDGTVTGNKIAPVRSACAVVVSSQNQNRDWIYYGQQTVSAEGFSGTAFSPYVPHTVRAQETRTCTECHVSSTNDNNAWMAQLLLQGTNFLNYLGRFAWVATGKNGVEAIAFAERQEPEAVIGSDFHEIAYPANYQRHKDRHFELSEAYGHKGNDVLDVQVRGEYLYAAMGKGGLRVYDVANIENKDFSQRIITAPVSPRGQRFFVSTQYATAVAAPSTTAIDPTRTQRPENEEKKPELMYGFLYVADKYEGLVVVGENPEKSKMAGVSTLLDGEPRNNFLKRQPKFNPGQKLNGARRITIAGFYAYILCDAGLVVVNIKDPIHPEIVATIDKTKGLNNPRGIAIQFRYVFVVDSDGLKVLDVTDLAEPRVIPSATLARPELADARNITVSRTYAYIAAGKQGMGIVNVKKPEEPEFMEAFTGDGNIRLQDTNDIKVGMVSSSQFALVADGAFGFKVIQLFSPQTVPGFYGFSPKPAPKVIAEYQTHGLALAVSRGVDRDRAVDESGNQLSVFGRRGSRPFNLPEMQKLYLCNQEMEKQGLCRKDELYTVTDDPKHPIDARKPVVAGNPGTR